METFGFRAAGLCEGGEAPWLEKCFGSCEAVAEYLIRRFGSLYDARWARDEVTGLC